MRVLYNEHKLKIFKFDYFLYKMVYVPCLLNEYSE
jgi:hypothetical protein